MARTTDSRLSTQAARLALVATALVLATGAGAQSSGSERAARAAARAEARSHMAPNPAILALVRGADSTDSVTKQKQQLGREVFRDTNLSQPAGQSCASCHKASRAFSDKGATSAGANPLLFGFRNAPDITYALYTPPLERAVEDGATGWMGGLFRDGRAPTLDAQVAFPLTNPIEMGNPDMATVVAKVAAASYAGTFQQIYGTDVFQNQDVAVAAIEDAIATYERGPEFRRFDSKYDAWWAGETTLTDSEERGREIFNDPDRGNCALCHLTQADKVLNHALFTDFGYDNVGVPRNPANKYYGMPPNINPDGRNFVDIGLQDVKSDKHGTRGQFKSPSLRNVAITGPYMHNGYFKTLRGVLDFYNTRDVKPACPDKFTSEADAEAQGCWPVAEVTSTVNKQDFGNLHLSDQDIDDILAFLNTLTDGWTPGADSPRH